MENITSLCNLFRAELLRRRPVMGMGDFLFLRFESFVDGYRLALIWEQLIFQLFDKHFGEQKSDEYYVQLLEVY
jgi:hypothetical protein